MWSLLRANSSCGSPSAERVQWHSQMGSSSTTHSASWSVAADNVVGTTGQTGRNKGAFQII
jgi:hypothetical protein